MSFNAVNSVKFHGNNQASNTDFYCTDVVPNTNITIEAGDLLGACVFEPDRDTGHHLELNVVGKVENNSESLLIARNNGEFEDICTDHGILAGTITTTQLKAKSKRRLHLYADYNLGIL